MRPLLVSGCLIAAVAPAFAADEVVEVVVEGTQHVHPDRILSRIKTQPGQPLQQVVINDDVRTIAEMGPFLNPTIVPEPVPGEPGKWRVVIRVQELPFVGEVELEGIGYFQRSKARELLRTVEHGHLNPLIVEADRRALLDYLRKQNYLHATVEARTRVDEESGVATITFIADRGREVEVARTRYRGLPEGAYKYFLDNRHVLNRPEAPFSPDMLRFHDRPQVERYLHGLGYLDAEVTEVQVQFFDEVQAYEERARNGPRLVPEGRLNNQVVITYHIEAGERYRLGSVAFVGSETVPETVLREAFGMPAGSWYDRSDIEIGKDEVLAIFRNSGHARAVLLENPVADRENLTVDLTLQLRHIVDERTRRTGPGQGPRYRIGRVDIDGNIKTKDAVVRRSMRLHPGDLWSDEARDNSRRQILREGVFLNQPGRPINIVPLYEGERAVPGTEDLQEVDLLVDVDEARTGSFKFNIGFASSVGIIGQVDYSERNFDLWGLLTGQGWRGAAHRLDASVSWSDERTSLSASWTNPHIMDGPYLLGLSFSRNESSALDWDETRLTSTVTLGRNFLDNDLRLRLAYSYIDLEIDDVDNDALDEAANQRGQLWANRLSFSQEYTLLDHPFFPTEGWRGELRQALSGGFDEYFTANADFVELSGEFDGFVPLARSGLGGVTFLHFAQRITWLEPIGDTDQVPFYERIFGGGPAPRHRGFDRFDLGPRELNRNGFDSRFGGTLEYQAAIEVSVPITGVNDGLRGVVFFDIGNVWGAEDSVDAGDLRYAAGFGIRFPAAFPVAFDYAFLLDAEDGEDRTQFHFTLSGFTF